MPTAEARVRQAMLAGEDILVVTPRPSGAATCHLPPAGQGGLTLVVSPRRAVLLEEVDHLRAQGVAAAALESPGRVEEAILLAAAQGRLQLLYLAPGWLTSPRLRRALSGRAVSRVVIDRAQAIVPASRRFGLDYLALPDFLANLGQPPLTALAPLASRQEQRAILEALGRPAARRLVSGFDQPDLFLAVEHCPTGRHKAAALLDNLRQLRGPAVIYTGTRAEAESIARGLTARHGIRAVPCADGQAVGVRRAAWQALGEGRAQVLVAVRPVELPPGHNFQAVIHWTLPADLGSYYQAIAGAGSATARGLALLLSSPEDYRLRQWQLAAATPSAAHLAAVTRRIAAGRGTTGSCGMSPVALRRSLRVLCRSGIVRPSAPGGQWVLERVPQPGELALLANAAAERRAAQQRLLAEMGHYTRDTGCRWATLLAHFGQADSRPRSSCCDCCRARAARPTPAALPGRSGCQRPSTPAEMAAVEADGRSLDARVLEIVAAHEGRLTAAGVARAMGNLSSDGAGRPRLRDVHAAVTRLLEAGLLVAYHGAGPARLALTRRGRARAGGGSRVAEEAVGYRWGRPGARRLAGA